MLNNKALIAAQYFRNSDSFHQYNDLHFIGEEPLGQGVVYLAEVLEL